MQEPEAMQRNWLDGSQVVVAEGNNKQEQEQVTVLFLVSNQILMELL